MRYKWHFELFTYSISSVNFLGGSKLYMINKILQLSFHLSFLHSNCNKLFIFFINGIMFMYLI